MSRGQINREDCIAPVIQVERSCFENQQSPVYFFFCFISLVINFMFLLTVLKHRSLILVGKFATISATSQATRITIPTFAHT